MRWTPRAILEELRARHARAAPMSYRALAKSRRALVSAAAYHFGSFKNALEAAGIDYRAIASRPKWTKPAVIRVIKQARREGKDLCWSAVIARRGLLRRAAYVAVQKRMFGGWPRALEAAGVDADSSRRYQGWDKTVIALELKQLRADGEPTNSYAVLQSNPALHAAAVRHYGSFAKALRAAGLMGKRRRRKPRRRTGK